MSMKIGVTDETRPEDPQGPQMGAARALVVGPLVADHQADWQGALSRERLEEARDRPVRSTEEALARFEPEADVSLSPVEQAAQEAALREAGVAPGQVPDGEWRVRGVVRKMADFSPEAVQRNAPGWAQNTAAELFSAAERYRRVGQALRPVLQDAARREELRTALALLDELIGALDEEEQP